MLQISIHVGLGIVEAGSENQVNFNLKFVRLSTFFNVIVFLLLLPV